jgi:hypothetical protein
MSKKRNAIVLADVINEVAANDSERAMLVRFTRGLTWRSPEMIEKLSVVTAKVAEEFKRSGHVLLISLSDGSKSWATASLSVKRSIEGTHRIATADEVDAPQAAEAR